MKNFKNFLLGISIAGLSLSSCSMKQSSVTNYEVIPMPLEITTGTQTDFILKNGITICYPQGNALIKRNAEFLAEYIKEQTGIELSIKEGNGTNGDIVLSLGLEEKSPEAYLLEINSKNIKIKGASEAGIFYGIQTLRKAIGVAPAPKVALQAVEIKDQPEFSYRGMMLDVCRHFFTVEEVKNYIDILALHNVNRLHLHLTEDQGWRIEIKKYPLLTEIGSKRKETVIGHNTGKYDGIPHSGFYTQEEAKDIVAYAKERFITVIPEIDLPGHMQAALSAYPELGCTGGPYEVWTKWGVSDNVLCAGNEKTIEFLKDVLTEIIDIFPSQYIHVGGDECPKTQWTKCPKCQAKAHALHLKTDKKHTKEQKLQSYIMAEMETFLNSKGRKLIGWDEILEGGLSPNSTVMSWRGEKGGMEAAKQNHDVIMTPNSYVYFDYYQSSDKEHEPEAIGGYLPMERVYSYCPKPKTLTPEEQKHIIGVQANVWTEYMPNFKQVQYMVLPRIAALCESQWSTPEKKDYKRFMSRITKLVEIYKLNKWNFATHIFDVDLNMIPDVQSKTLNVDAKTIDNAPIYYTLDGTEPTAQSKKYQNILKINQSTHLRTVAIRPDGQSRTTNDIINFSKSTLKPITMLQPINKKFQHKGAITLVDGLTGLNNYKTNRWIGFYDNDMEAVIDLEEATEVSKVSINTCVEKGDWIFDARGICVSVSNDNKSYVEVKSENYPAMKKEDANKVYTHQLNFDPVKTRYIKVKAISEKSIPAWHGGKGHTGFLFIDEIRVD